jgi:uncharacterized protein with PQ loop repeat
MDTLEIIGYLATLFGATQLIPEIIKALRTHHLRDVSWGMLALMLSSSTLWVAYSLGKQITPLAISAGMNFLFETMLIFLKIYYSKTKRPLLNRPAIQTSPVKNEE